MTLTNRFNNGDDNFDHYVVMCVSCIPIANSLYLDVLAFCDVITYFSYCLQESRNKFRFFRLQTCMQRNFNSSHDYKRDGDSDQGIGKGRESSLCFY
jgi:hypothetical protein